MLNDIIHYSLRYELWSYETTSFYKEFEYDEFVRFADLDGNTIDITPEFISVTVLVDDTIDLVPEWLKQI
jgi:hypothetical protein